MQRLPLFNNKVIDRLVMHPLAYPKRLFGFLNLNHHLILNPYVDSK